ncbi:MAG: S8 family peptidase, partial [Flavitalea sp.]
RSILLNTAGDSGPAGIDFQTGYGNLNAYNAIKAMLNKWYRSGIVSEGQVERFHFDVPLNVSRFKVTVCWNDAPGKPNDATSLVNDIDMRLVNDLSGSAWHPWVLNSYPHPDSLGQLPTRKKDSINNAEQITVDHPAGGSYTIEISGHKIPSGSQPFSFSYHLDTLNHFQWEYPTAGNVLEAGRRHALRWASTFIATNAHLYYSKDSGNHWELIADNVDLTKNHFSWNAGAVPGVVLFRMLINSQSFISDTSLISSQLSTRVGFNCPDSFLIYWNKHLNVSGYTIYQLGNRYLEPFKIVPDTSIVLRKSTNKALHYAVAPNIQGRTGSRSYTFDYTTQGIGCYVKRFTVDLLNFNLGSIQLELGTRYEIKDVTLEKWQRDGFIPLQKIPDTSSLLFNFTDDKLISGGNRYRIKISLGNGNTVFSNIETIYYLTGKNYLVYPNPAKTNFMIVSNDSDSSELILYNTIGQEVFRKKLSSLVQHISVPHLKSGLYFLVVRQRNKKVHQGNLIIQ